jgi:hypothetical protein
LHSLLCGARRERLRTRKGGRVCQHEGIVIVVDEGSRFSC